MVTTEQEERRSVLQVPTSRYSQAFHDGIKDQTQGVVLIASEVDIVMFDSCFRTYCGEGDEEAEYGAVVDPGDYRWSKKHEETISFRRRVNHISNLERQINYRVERQRRENIYASSIDIDDYEPPVFAKSQDEKDAIQAALADNFIFQDLDDAEKNMFIDAMQRVIFDEGFTIIEQGMEGDFFSTSSRKATWLSSMVKIELERLHIGDLSGSWLFCTMPRARFPVSRSVGAFFGGSISVPSVISSHSKLTSSNGRRKTSCIESSYSKTSMMRPCRA